LLPRSPNPTYWVNLVTASNKANPGAADAVYVQCYANLGNDPSEWNVTFNLPVLK